MDHELLSIVIEWSAWRQIVKLPRDLQARIAAAIDTLARDPQPAGSRLLRGEERRYRIRVGPYRIVYRVEHDKGRVIVLAVGHRREIYR